MPRRSAVNLTIAPAKGRLFTAEQSAKYLGISVSRMRRLIARREVAVLRNVNGRLEGVYQADADAWIEKRRTPVIDERLLRAHDVDARVRTMMPARKVFA